MVVKIFFLVQVSEYLILNVKQRFEIIKENTTEDHWSWNEYRRKVWFLEQLDTWKFCGWMFFFRNLKSSLKVVAFLCRRLRRGSESCYGVKLFLSLESQWFKQWRKVNKCAVNKIRNRKEKVWELLSWNYLKATDEEKKRLNL